MAKRFLLGISILWTFLGICSCTKSPADYFPLTTGRVWTYQVSLKGPFGQEVDVRTTITNLAARPLRGRTVTPQKMEFQALGRSHYEFQYMAEDRDGVYRFADQDSGDVEPKIESSTEYTLKAPLKSGTSWHATVDLPRGQPVPGVATIEGTKDVVDVPAGTFKDCIKVRIVGATKETAANEEYVWYAPSVGLVKEVTKALGNSSSLQLVSFSK